MIKNIYSGKFIVLEGLDGAGKTTQAELLKKYFKEIGKRTFRFTMEPTESRIGKIIRAYFCGDSQITPKSLQLLFAADRADHLQREIIPCLRKGINVISDRYYLSSLAYGAVENRMNWLAAVNSQFVTPDLTVFLNVFPDVCVKRLKKERGALELYEKIEILEKVRQNYKKAFKLSSGPVKILDANKNKEDICAEIISIINDLVK